MKYPFRKGFILGIITILTIIILLDWKGYGFAIYSGSSMCPTYGLYDISFSRDVNLYEELEIGEIYAYRNFIDYDYYLVNKGKYHRVAHRLITYNNETDKYIFCGDNNNGNCEEKDRKDIISKEIFHIKLVPCKR